MSIDNIRRLKELAKEPKAPKKYIIPKISKKRQAQFKENKKQQN